MSTMNTMHQCMACKEWYVAAHYCRGLNLGGEPRPGAAPVQPLTEADIRRIVREELARAAAALAGDREQS